MARATSLDVWLYGTHIATVHDFGAAGADRPELTWSAEAVGRWGVGSRLLSAKLPIGRAVVPALVRNYLDGLLPEGNARINHALAVGITPDDTFGLMAAYGRDTPGAAIFTAGGQSDPTRAGHYAPLTRAEVAGRLRSADKFSPARLGETVESSTVPGMVPKVALHRTVTAASDTWYACKDGAASTWIVKRGVPEGNDLSDTIDTEAACLALAHDLGLTGIQAEVVTFADDHGGVRAIAVSRYDRVIHANGTSAEGGETVSRLHQEDLAQAIGLNTADPNRKFQWGARMPSLRHAAEVLRLDGGRREQLLRLVTFAHLVGNTDMHAKNISFLRRLDGRVELAPAYDVAMHLHHEREARRFALDVNGKYLVDEPRAAVTIDDLVAEGESWGIQGRLARSTVHHVVEDLAAALDRVDVDRYPGVTDRAWSTVRDRVTHARSSSAAGRNSPSEERLAPTRPPVRRGPRTPG